MPVIKCSNGKWRIGSGLCQYDTKEKATEVYVAIISSGSLEAQGNKVSFDFDDTLSTQRGQDIAKRLMNDNKTVYIITRRQESDSKEVYKIADELGIPRSRVYFTNGSLKWETVKRLEIGTHYDNNQNEVDKIRENTDAKAIKF
jgi:hypothetical protein